MTRRPLAWSFVALALLYVAPVWSTHYVPTGDGPCHLYNAWILKDLLTGDAPPQIARAYEVDWRPHPNWSGHLILAALMIVFPPLVAEKLFVSLIVLTLLGGAWMLATANGREGEPYAFLAFPFVWTQPFVAGFYNYVLSLGLYCIILALWWRRRLVATTLLLILCYFTHPVATAYACGAIVLFALLTRRFLHMLCVIPVIPLLLWFARRGPAGEPDFTTIQWEVLGVLTHAIPVLGFDGRQNAIAFSTSAIFAILIVYTLIRERRFRAVGVFGLAALFYVIALFWVPAGSLARALIRDRTPLLVFLTLLAWFTPRLPRYARIALVTLLTISAAANGAMIIERFRTFGPEVGKIARALDAIAPDSTFVPLLFEQPRAPSYVNVYAHALSYGALERRLVDLSNYEPSTGYFPIRHHRDSMPMDVHRLVVAPGETDPRVLAMRAEYVFAFQMPPTAPNRAELERLYRVVKFDGAAVTYRVRDPMLHHRELIVLPLVGTARPVGAPQGARWEIVQTARNDGTRPVSAAVFDCREDIPCRFDIAPGASVRIASSDRRFAVLMVPRGTARQLAFTTVARRADADLPELSVHVPAVHEREFTRGRTRIPDVAAGGRKVSLRIYALGTLAMNDVTYTVRANGKAIASHKVGVPGFGMHENADLGTLFPDLSSHAGNVDIEIEGGPDVRLWAFVTATDAAGRARVYVPR